MMRLSPWLCAALALPLPGCCSLARLFCGPDRTPWVSVRFDTPEQAVQTLLEAIRRDEPEVVYLSLADEYRRRLGLDNAIAQLAWARLREENPGLHVAGYATVPPPVRLVDDGATFELDVEGNRLVIDVVRQSFWEIRYRRANGTQGDDGAPIASWAPYATLTPVAGTDIETSELHLAPRRFEHEGLETLQLDQLEHVALTRRWKVASIRMPQPQ